MFQVVDKSSGDAKIVSRSKAKVIDNKDPQKKGRIRVFHPLMGETGFIPYLSAPGSFSVPDIDDVVFLEAEAGYLNHAVAWGNVNSQSNDSPDFPDVFQRVIPTNRGFFTSGGHLIELDDGKGPASTGQGIRITTSGGIIIGLDDLQDTISVTTSAGTNVEINGTDDSIIATTNFGDTLELSASNGFKTDTPAAGGTTLQQTNGQVTINGNLGVKITDGMGGEINIAEGKVAIGNDVAELFEQLVTLLQAFTTAAPTFVSTAVGPGVLDPTLAAAIASATTALTAIQGSL